MKRKYQKNIIFSHTPFTTCFVYKDIFQIYPLTFTDAPISKLVKFFPLVIEYWYDEDEEIEVSDNLSDIKNFISNSTKATNKLNKLTRLLTTVTNYEFFSYFDTKFKYGITVKNDVIDEKLNSLVSECVMDTYYYPNMQSDTTITEFTKGLSTTTHCNEHFDYYFNDPFESQDKVITFPCTLIKILDAYFSLDKKRQSVFDSICHLFNNGLEIQYKMKSLSFLAHVSCIESLVNLEFYSQNKNIRYDCNICKKLNESPFQCECGEPTWAISFKFREFLKAYISNNEENLQTYKDIYNVRSRLVHEGLLLLGDVSFDWGDSEKKDKQYTLREETMQFVRLSVVNYLLFGPNRTEKLTAPTAN